MGLTSYGGLAIGWDDGCRGRETAECVGDDVSFAGLVLDGERVRLEGDEPAEDAVVGRCGEVEGSAGDELRGRFVVRANSECVSEKIRAEVLYCPYYCIEFFFPHGVLELCFGKCLRYECDGTFAMVVLLGKDGA